MSLAAAAHAICRRYASLTEAQAHAWAAKVDAQVRIDPWGRGPRYWAIFLGLAGNNLDRVLLELGQPPAPRGRVPVMRVRRAFYIKRLFPALVLLLALPACIIPRPKPPTPPTPTPVPTPTPTPGVPAKGVPVLTELLLRQTPPRLTRGGEPFTPSGATQCCMATEIGAASRMPRKPKRMNVRGVVVNSRWPSVSAEVQDFFAREGGANFFAIRVAPYYARPGIPDEDEWDDIGGPVSTWPEWNQAWWDENRKILWHAGSVLKANVQVEWDAWYGKTCKNGSQPCAWPDPEIQAWGETFTAGHQRFIDKIVEEFGCFANVVWQVDNEGALVPRVRREYYEAVHWAFRDAEQRLGCGIVHMTGINWPEVGDGPYDYVTTHADAALTTPFYGKHSQNNEHNRPVSVDEDYSRFVQARDAGLHYWYWRAEDSDADMRAKLARRKGGAAPAECFAPDPEDPLWDPTPLTPGQRPAQMMAALNAAKAAVGDRCGATAPCAAEPCAPPVHLGCLETNGLVAAELRKQGYCASGPWADATAILAPDGYWEEMHVCSTGNGCYTGNPYLKAWKYNGQNPTPAPACGDPQPPTVMQWGVKIHTQGPDWTTLDSTPLVGHADYCASIGFTDGRARCSVRQEGAADRAACEALAVGTPQWTAPAGWQPYPSGNPYMIRVPRGVTGTAKVCASVAPTVCGSLEVTTP